MSAGRGELLLQIQPAQSGQLHVQDQAARHVRPMGMGTPYANVLLAARRP